jgi:hypothetical protein
MCDEEPANIATGIHPVRLRADWGKPGSTYRGGVANATRAGRGPPPASETPITS